MASGVTGHKPRRNARSLLAVLRTDNTSGNNLSVRNEKSGSVRIGLPLGQIPPETFFAAPYSGIGSSLVISSNRVVSPGT